MTPQLIARGLPDPDADVLELIERRELDGALCVLMKRHGTAIYRFCREALHDDMLADDVHQQIFIEVSRDLVQFGRRSTLRSWLFGIARHRVLDFAKQRKRARARDDAAAAAYDDTGPPPSVLLDDARLHAALIECLRELDDDVLTALLLRYQQGFTFEEMAGVCGEKPSTLHARVSRALPALRARIERRIARSLRRAAR